MTDKSNKVMDLDELFGQSRAIKVRWDGREYDLMRMAALGPRAISRFQKLHQQASRLQRMNLTAEINDEQEREIIELFDQMLGMLCRDLPISEMPFAAKSRALEYYVVETEQKKAKDVGGRGKRQRTGATSIRG